MSNYVHTGEDLAFSIQLDVLYQIIQLPCVLVIRLET